MQQISADSRHHRIERRALGAILAMLLPVVITVNAPESRAGTQAQGTRGQGTQIQGTRGQGTRGQGTRGQGTQVQNAGFTSEQELGRLLQGERFTATLTGPRYPTPLPVELSRFRGETAMGRVWRPAIGWRPAELHAGDLVGMHWSARTCDESDDCVLWFRVRAAEMDRSRNTMPDRADDSGDNPGGNDDVWLYTVEYSDDPVKQRWLPVCEPGSGGAGLFVDGQWSPDGTWRPGGYTFSCTDGVIAKCVRGWGYKPWKSLPASDGQDVSLLGLHLACVRAARADYCGDGVSYSRDGTVVDMFDVYGFNTRDSGTGFRREAGFTAEGARWMAHKRWPTAGQDDSPLIELPTCQRPRYAPASEHDQVLIQVWSKPGEASPGNPLAYATTPHPGTR